MLGRVHRVFSVVVVAVDCIFYPALCVSTSRKREMSGKHQINMTKKIVQWYNNNLIRLVGFGLGASERHGNEEKDNVTHTNDGDDVVLIL